MRMGLFDRTEAKLKAGPTLLLPSDPGPAFLETLQLYDPEVRRWHGRMVFSNGVLLFGPVEVTPKLAESAGLPPGAAIAWYAQPALQRHSQRRSDAQKRGDGERLLLGLVARVGGTIHPAPTIKPPSLVASVYSEQGLPRDQVIEALRPFAGDLKPEEVKGESYALSGDHAGFYTAYRPPESFIAQIEPAALGKLSERHPHHWDLHAGVRASRAPRELALKVGGAAVALAQQSDGIAVDSLGFRFTAPEELLPR
jgi:hypothetical protein